MSNVITVPGRDINTVTTEIRMITRDTQQLILSAAIKIGQRLVEAKELVPHGEWGDYLKHEVEFSQSTANNFMRLYQEYGSNQESLFGPANSQAFENLTYTKALRLLALPEEERESFVEENPVAEMSTRELEKAIRERDQARRDAREQEQMRIAAEAAVADQEKEIASIRDKERQAEQAVREMKALEEALAAAKEAERDARDQLAAAKNPEIPEDTMEALRREAEAQAASDAREETEKKLAAAKEKADRELKAAREKAAKALKDAQEKASKAMQEAQAAAEKAQAAIREQLELAEGERDAARKKLEAAMKNVRLSDPNVAVFKVIYEQVQTNFNSLKGALKKVEANDAAMAGKLRTAVKAMLDKMGEGL